MQKQQVERSRGVNVLVNPDTEVIPWQEKLQLAMRFEHSQTHSEVKTAKKWQPPPNKHRRVHHAKGAVEDVMIGARGGGDQKGRRQQRQGSQPTGDGKWQSGCAAFDPAATDVCPDCGAVLLDPGELEQLAGHETDATVLKTLAGFFTLGTSK